MKTEQENIKEILHNEKQAKIRVQCIINYNAYIFFWLLKVV